MEPCGGDHLVAELTSADKAALDELADNEEVVTAVAEEVEAEDDPEVEILEED